mmetsp:Transcript_1694/g.6763  ORF Transcript_1694/g.6763 Transcript_1694/m.6763 type:complete len:373 (+) Transcript_1694:2675-3793(+)
MAPRGQAAHSSPAPNAQTRPPRTASASMQSAPGAGYPTQAAVKDSPAADNAVTVERLEAVEATRPTALADPASADASMRMRRDPCRSCVTRAAASAPMPEAPATQPPSRAPATSCGARAAWLAAMAAASHVTMSGAAPAPAPAPVAAEPGVLRQPPAPALRPVATTPASASPGSIKAGLTTTRGRDPQPASLAALPLLPGTLANAGACTSAVPAGGSEAFVVAEADASAADPPAHAQRSDGSITRAATPEPTTSSTSASAVPTNTRTPAPKHLAAATCVGSTPRLTTAAAPAHTSSTSRDPDARRMRGEPRRAVAPAATDGASPRESCASNCVSDCLGGDAGSSGARAAAESAAASSAKASHDLSADTLDGA